VLAEGGALLAFIKVDQPDVHLDALGVGFAHQVFDQVEVFISRSDELGELPAVPHHAAVALFRTHHYFVDVGALELGDESAHGLHRGSGVAGAGPDGVAFTGLGWRRIVRSELRDAQGARERAGRLAASELHTVFTTGVRESTGGRAGKSVKGADWYQ
jgi:hypothetical protein